jgi:hypothetical protein
MRVSSKFFDIFTAEGFGLLLVFGRGVPETKILQHQSPGFLRLISHTFKAPFIPEAVVPIQNNPPHFPVLKGKPKQFRFGVFRQNVLEGPKIRITGRVAACYHRV